MARFVESIYWQYFCGMQEIQWKCPVNPTTLGRWRKRLADKGLGDLLSSTIQAGRSTGALWEADTKHLIVDTTVQEKAIAHPTDARLCIACDRNWSHWQSVQGFPCAKATSGWERSCSFATTGKGTSSTIAWPTRRSRSFAPIWERSWRDLERKMSQASEVLQEKIREALNLAGQVHGQVKQKKAVGRVFSLHEPQVDCIGKGKVHKAWEFGCKIGLVSTSHSNFIMASKAYPGNPYDGHVLLEAFKHVPSPWLPQVSVDQGFKGHAISGMRINIVGRYLPKDPTCRKWMKRQAAIEPLIGHLKNDNGYRLNHLKGAESDKHAAILSACGYNLRQCLRAIARRFVSLFGLGECEILDALVAALERHFMIPAAA